MSLLPRSLVRLAALASLLALAGSCGTADSDEQSSSEVCVAASAHMEGCFGPQAAELFPVAGCDEYSASRVVELGCDALANSVVEGKADGLVDQAVQEAIWEAVRQAIEAAMTQVIDGVMETLGASLDDYAFYVVFHEADSEAAAQQMAADLGAVLADDPTMSPVVYEQGGTYYVLHGPCPVELQSGLANLIADVIVTHRQIVRVLGGTVTEESAEDGSSTISISLSFGLLPGALSLPATLGCGS
jgi:hypothetical protein